MQFAVPSCPSRLTSFLAPRSDIFCQWISKFGNRPIGQSARRRHNKKSRGFLLCFFPAGTLPQVLCQIQNLLQRGFGTGAGGHRSTSVGVTHDSICD
jgi:hypothetical protein